MSVSDLREKLNKDRAEVYDLIRLSRRSIDALLFVMVKTGDYINDDKLRGLVSLVEAMKIVSERARDLSEQTEISVNKMEATTNELWSEIICSKGSGE